ncbi:KAP family P-loop NTPase fold protein [Parasporobacterium paucivorans]|uniref:KAP family P-loop domain-containing protein n=1 Tax=Parasporobacterium paucivorans DSM 15970 TaxID=1122934 RepID=A0A1M6KL49_9FIRM|nr:P-loop NTPase fold protein [Parasporobacterium paucivorans]SHJ59693.1 KAP family P-loop domain-containing protein [Parasporobacterium paucivorans DSM 15970]
MYFEDSPIKKQEEDLLGRKGFAKKLGASLLNAQAKDGYCVGLFGPWGSGKSSVVNMIIEEIKILSEEEEKPIIIYFNPWNFSSKDQLLRQYFITLANQFSGKKDKAKLIIGNEIRKYSDMLGDFGDIGKIAKFSGRFIGKVLNKNNILSTEDISKQRESLINTLSEQKQKIIIVIDDIDRLSNEEIKLIFQLVTSVAKFPNIIYLLSFDKEIVARALTEVQNYDGEKYLEKIIQVPVEIPNVSNDFLWKALFDKLDSLLKEYEGITFEQDYWSLIFSEVISRYIYNIRDVIRLTNALNIKCDLIGSEINFADLITLTTIEIKLPKLYLWIRANKGKLVGGEDEYFRFYNQTKDKIEEMQLMDLKKIDSNYAKEFDRILKVLFPHYNSKTSNSFYDEKLLRRMKRIGNQDIFDRYFRLELNADKLQKVEFENAVNGMDEEDLYKFLTKINANNSMISFLQDLAAVNDEVKIERIPIIIKALVKVSGNAVGVQTNAMFSMSSFSLIEYRITDLMKRLSENERCQLLLELLDDADYESIQILSYMLNSFELSHGRLAAKGQTNGDKIVTIETLLICEDKFKIIIPRIMQEGNILDMNQAGFVSYMFECFEPELYEEYLYELFENDLNKVKYLILSAERWTGAGINWKYNDEYKKYITEVAVLNAMKNCIDNDTIWSLDEERLHRAIAFLLWSNKETEWTGGVDDKQVIQKIDKIKEEHTRIM